MKAILKQSSRSARPVLIDKIAHQFHPAICLAVRVQTPTSKEVFNCAAIFEHGTHSSFISETRRLIYQHGFYDEFTIEQGKRAVLWTMPAEVN